MAVKNKASKRKSATIKIKASAKVSKQVVATQREFDRSKSGSKVREGSRRPKLAEHTIIIPGQTPEQFYDAEMSPLIDMNNLGKGIRSKENVVQKGADSLVGQSTTEPLTHMSVSRTVAAAEEVHTRWVAKQKLFGTTVFHCPMCATKDRVNFPTPAKAKEHIRKIHPAQVEAFKLQKVATSLYTPMPVVLSPKRELEDLVPASQVKGMKLLAKTHAAMANIREAALHLSDKKMKASALLMQPEMLAAPKVKLLDDKEILVAARLAWSRGKATLLREIRKICKERNLTLTI